jgi:hypothetical protein
LKNRRHRPDVGRQHDAFDPAPAAVIVRANACLVHSRDEGGATRGAYRSRREGMTESGPFAREPIDIGRLDGFLPVTGKVRRHVVDDEPKDIRPDASRGNASDQAKERRKKKDMTGFHMGPHRLTGTRGMAIDAFGRDPFSVRLTFRRPRACRCARSIQAWLHAGGFSVSTKSCAGEKLTEPFQYLSSVVV